jgi:hypothetical protein
MKDRRCPSLARLRRADQGPERPFIGVKRSRQLRSRNVRGRDASYLAPPAQNRTCGFPAYGSHLGCVTADCCVLATCRTRSSACDTRSRYCARCVLCRLAFPSAPALGSTDSAAGCPALFIGFPATMAGSDFSRSCIIGCGSSPSRHGPVQHTYLSLLADREISRFPHKERPHMPKFFDHAGPGEHSR